MGDRKGSPDLLWEFYDLLGPRESWAMRPGQLYSAHVVYAQHWPTVVQVVNYDPLDERNSVFRIKPYSEGDERHYPIHSVGLREDEMWYVYTGKKRLVVVLGYVESEWLSKDRPQKVLMCAPVFGFQSRHTQEMVIRTQAFDYPNLFYLPPEPRGCYEESAVRFEMIQPIMKGYLQPFRSPLANKPVVLSDTAYRFLITHLVNYICGEVVDEQVHEDIRAYRDLLLESLDIFDT